MRKVLGVLFACALVIGLLGCAQQVVIPEGSISVTVDGGMGKKGINPNISMDVASYVVTGSGPDSKTFTQTLTTTKNCTAEHLVPGSWTVSVVAKNSSGTAIGGGSSTCTVSAGTTSDCSVTVNEYEGDGTLSVSLSWNTAVSPSPTFTVTATNQKDSKQTQFQLNVTENKASGSTKLANGFYLISITGATGITSQALETVRIAKDATTTLVYEIDNSKGGNGAITIIDTLEKTPTIDLSVTNLSVHQNGILHASSTITNAPDGAAVSWYLDGALLSGKSEKTLDLAMTTSQAVGTHRLVCVVSSSSVIWSEGKDFTVTAPVTVPTVTMSVDTTYTYGNAMSVTASGDLAGWSLQWLLDDAAVSGQTTGTFSLSSLEGKVGNHTLALRVEKEGVSGVAVRKTFFLNPKITVTYAPETIFQGGKAVFTATVVPEVSGASYAWKKNDYSVGSNSSTWEVDNLNWTADTYQVACEVSLSGKSLGSNLCYAVVKTNPITSFNCNNLYSYNSALSVSKTITGDGWSYDWQVNGTSVSTEASPNIPSSKFNYGKNTVKLTITKDGASYYVTDTMVKSPYLDIQVPSTAIRGCSFDAQLSMSPALEGATYQWKLDSTDITGQTTERLHVSNVDWAAITNAYMYCYVTYKDTTFTNCQSITVIDKPTLTMTIGNSDAENLKPSDNLSLSVTPSISDADYFYYLDGSETSFFSGNNKTSVSLSLKNMSKGIHKVKVKVNYAGQTFTDEKPFTIVADAFTSLSVSIKNTTPTEIDFNENLQLEATAYTGATYAWYFDDETTPRYTRSGNTLSRMVPASFAEGEHSVYVKMTYLGVEHTSEKATFTITNKKPRVKVILGDGHSNYSSKEMFSAFAEVYDGGCGWTYTTYEWYIDGAKIANETNDSLYEHVSQIGTTGTHTIAVHVSGKKKDGTTPFTIQSEDMYETSLSINSDEYSRASLSTNKGVYGSKDTTATVTVTLPTGYTVSKWVVDGEEKVSSDLTKTITLSKTPGSTYSIECQYKDGSSSYYSEVSCVICVRKDVIDVKDVWFKNILEKSSDTKPNFSAKWETIVLDGKNNYEDSFYTFSDNEKSSFTYGTETGTYASDGTTLTLTSSNNVGTKKTLADYQHLNDSANTEKTVQGTWNMPQIAPTSSLLNDVLDKYLNDSSDIPDEVKQLGKLLVSVKESQANTIDVSVKVDTDYITAFGKVSVEASIVDENLALAKPFVPWAKYRNAYGKDDMSEGSLSVDKKTPITYRMSEDGSVLLLSLTLAKDGAAHDFIMPLKRGAFTNPETKSAFSTTKKLTAKGALDFVTATYSNASINANLEKILWDVVKFDFGGKNCAGTWTVTSASWPENGTREFNLFTNRIMGDNDVSYEVENKSSNSFDVSISYHNGYYGDAKKAILKDLVLSADGKSVTGTMDLLSNGVFTTYPFSATKKDQDFVQFFNKLEAADMGMDSLGDFDFSLNFDNYQRVWVDMNNRSMEVGTYSLGSEGKTMTFFCNPNFMQNTVEGMQFGISLPVVDGKMMLLQDRTGTTQYGIAFE